MNVLLAPLQGFTDAIFRWVFMEHFGAIDALYAPYISLQNDGSIKRSQWRDILPENNAHDIVPQILPADAEEACLLVDKLIEIGIYQEVNINLGCPYPMVTRKGRGSGLLPHSSKIEEMLSCLTHKYGGQLDFSVKMRCGLEDFDELKALITVFNNFPLKNVIVHPRIAKQLYKGDVNLDAFESVYENVKHPIIYNGDVFTREYYDDIVTRFPEIAGVMLGRGVLYNPFLPQDIKENASLSEQERLERLKAFYQALFEANQSYLSGDSHLLNKMQSYLPYFFSWNFDKRKAFKKAKKAKSVKAYSDAMDEALSL